MKYQKIINLLDNTPNQLSKFRTKKWIEINDQSRGMYNVNSDIRFKTTMLKSSLCDYSDAYLLVTGTITITGDADDDAAKQADGGDKGVIFKNCASLINCKTEINNTGVDNAKDIDIIMPMFNSIECSGNYSKTSGSLWEYYKDEPNDNLTDSESFKSKTRSAMRCNNREDLLHLSSTWKISKFLEAYIQTSRTSMMELLLQKQ